MNDCIIQRQRIPDNLIGMLRECDSGPNDSKDLQRRLNEDGYILFRDILNSDDVRAARAEVFGRLEQVGEIKPPAIDGIATGESQRESVPDLGQFWRSVNEGTDLRNVTHGERLREIVSAVIGEPARPHDLMYLRPTAAGRSTNLHYDFPFFAGRSNRIVTAWIPLGDVPVSDGPLVIVEGSNRFSDLIDPIRQINYAADHSNETVQRAAYETQNAEGPLALVRKRGARFLTTDFRAGDLMIFSGFTMHGSLDNNSPVNRVRLSVDVRYQPASDPADDERYFGNNPSGSKGGGYADMRGAKPLTA